ncbi:MAG: RHS repeat domain-containing protein [Armatimonadota bacterium]
MAGQEANWTGLRGQCAGPGIPTVIQEDGIYYYRTPGGALIAQKNDTAWHYYHFDELGSTRLLTDSSGNVSDKYSYDAWGKLLWHEKVNANSIDQPYQYVGQFGYYMHWQEPEFGLVQLGVRFYDGEAGRFTQRDSTPTVGQSDYSYVGDCPTLRIDPSGRTMIGLPFNPWEPYLPKRPPSESPTECANNAIAEAHRIHATDDKLAHCFAACRIMRCLRPCQLISPIVSAIGWGIEFGPDGNKDFWDAVAQDIGIAVSYTGQGCREGCRRRIEAMRKKGKMPNDPGGGMT